MQSLINNCSGRFEFAEVVVLEDDPIYMAEITGNIKSNWNVDVVPARDLEEFCSVLKTRDFDIASIDCDISGRKVCEEALEALEDQITTVGKIIYTAHDKERYVAKKKGADAFILKDNTQKYMSSVEKQINEKQKKKIENFLIEKEFDISSLSKNDGEAKEKELYNLAYSYILKCLIKGGEYYPIITMLKKRGCWVDFREEEYGESNWSEKIKSAMKTTELKEEDIKKIFIEDSGRIKSLLEKKYGSDGMPKVIYEKLDTFLSIYSYLLKTCSYLLPMIPLFFSEENIYEKSLNPPPWVNQSLRSFLINEGPYGMQKSLEWIRSR